MSGLEHLDEGPSSSDNNDSVGAGDNNTSESDGKIKTAETKEEIEWTPDYGDTDLDKDKSLFLLCSHLHPDSEPDGRLWSQVRC